MAVKEPGWILEAPGKRKMEIKGENGDDNRKRIETQRLQTKNIYIYHLVLQLQLYYSVVHCSASRGDRDPSYISTLQEVTSSDVV